MAMVLSVMWSAFAGGFVGYSYYKLSAGPKRSRVAVGILTSILFGFLCAGAAFGG